jgi:hypothetical protein
MAASRTKPLENGASVAPSTTVVLQKIAHNRERQETQILDPRCTAGGKALISDASQNIQRTKLEVGKKFAVEVHAPESKTRANDFFCDGVWLHAGGTHCLIESHDFIDTFLHRCRFHYPAFTGRKKLVRVQKKTELQEAWMRFTCCRPRDPLHVLEPFLVMSARTSGRPCLHFRNPKPSKVPQGELLPPQRQRQHPP